MNSPVLREDKSYRDILKAQFQEGTDLEETSQKAIATVQVRDDETQAKLVAEIMISWEKMSPHMTEDPDLCTLSALRLMGK